MTTTASHALLPLPAVRARLQARPWLEEELETLLEELLAHLLELLALALKEEKTMAAAVAAAALERRHFPSSLSSPPPQSRPHSLLQRRPGRLPIDLLMDGGYS